MTVTTFTNTTTDRSSQKAQTLESQQRRKPLVKKVSRNKWMNNHFRKDISRETTTKRLISKKSYILKRASIVEIKNCQESS